MTEFRANRKRNSVVFYLAQIQRYSKIRKKSIFINQKRKNYIKNIWISLRKRRIILLRQKNGESDGKHPAAVVFILPRRKMYDKKNTDCSFRLCWQKLYPKRQRSDRRFWTEYNSKIKMFSVCQIAVYYRMTPKRPLIIFSTVRQINNFFRQKRTAIRLEIKTVFSRIKGVYWNGNQEKCCSRSPRRS